jgi:glyoxylase-like metal-dependent hydrolase (beta-lactamase superfamily II)
MYKQIKKSLLITGAALSLLVGSFATFAQQTVPDVKATELRGGIYVLEGSGGHVGVSTGESGSFVIDSQFSAIAEKLIKKIKELSDKDIKILLNTHWHGDHVGGNVAFAQAGAVIMAHENVLPRVSELTARPTLPAPKSMPLPEQGRPSVLINDEGLSLVMNGQEITVVHEPEAHTDGDVWVYFKQANIIHTGDLQFHAVFPFIDVDTGGTIDGYISAQENIYAAANDNTIIISGHVTPGGDPVGNKARLAEDIKVLKEVRKIMTEVVASGISLEQAQEARPLAELAKTHGNWFITEERMVRLIYTDLKKRLN